MMIHRIAGLRRMAATFFRKDSVEDMNEPQINTDFH